MGLLDRETHARSSVVALRRGQGRRRARAAPVGHRVLLEGPARAGSAVRRVDARRHRAESMNSVDRRRVQITAVQSEPARGLRRRTPRLSRRRPGSARGRTFTVSRATIRSSLVFAPLARTRCRAGAYALTPRADPSAREPGRLRTGETRVAAFESTRPDTAGGEARLSEVTLRPLKISKGRNVVSHGESRIPTGI